MRQILFVIVLLQFASLLSVSLLSAQDKPTLEQLQDTIKKNTKPQLPPDLGKVPPASEDVQAAATVLQAANQVLTESGLSKKFRDWTLKRKAFALIVLTYADPQTYYTQLVDIGSALEEDEGNKAVADEVERHILTMGILIAVRMKQTVDGKGPGINIKSLAERMVIYADAHPGQEAERLIDLFLAEIRRLPPNARDRRLASVTPVFQQHFKEINHTARAQALQTDINRATLLDKPMILTGVDLAGNDFDPETIRNKVVLVQFWGTWCAHCNAEIPDFINLYEKYHSAGFEIIGVNTAAKGDESAEKVKQFVNTKQYGGKTIPWKILHEGLAMRKNKATISEFYGIDELPILMLIGRNGKVISLHPLPSTLDTQIAAALKFIEFTEEEKAQVEAAKKKREAELDQKIQEELKQKE